MASDEQLTASETSFIDKRILFVCDLPTFISNNIHLLSSCHWFGQFGQILCINVNNTNNCAHIKFATEAAADNAKTWTNSYESSLQAHAEFGESTDDICCSTEILNEFEELKNEFKEVKMNKQQLIIENKEKQFEEQIKQFQGQIAQFFTKKQEMEQMLYSVNQMNFDLTQQIQTMQTDFNDTIRQKTSLKDRLNKLDKKYVTIFKQLVNRILDIEKKYIKQTNVASNLSFAESFAESFNRRTKQSTNNTNDRNNINEYQNNITYYKCELNEKYDDLCNINSYVIELEKKLNLELEYSYKTWDIYDVYRWIITIKNGRFNKNNKDLMIQLRKYAIYGARLADLNHDDLMKIGITYTFDRKLLLSEIGLLIQNERN